MLLLMIPQIREAIIYERKIALASRLTVVIGHVNNAEKCSNTLLVLYNDITFAKNPPTSSGLVCCTNFIIRDFECAFCESI